MRTWTNNSLGHNHMAATTHLSYSTQGHSQGPRRHSRRIEAADNGSGTPTSKTFPHQDRPNVNDLRRARTDFYRKSPEERRREARAAMLRDDEPRRSSSVKIKSEKGARVTVRRVRRDSLDHEPRRQNARERGGASEDHVYVYKSIGDVKKPSSTEQRPSLRRSKTTVTASRLHQEPRRHEDHGPHRSNTDRRVSKIRDEETLVRRVVRTRQDAESRRSSESHQNHPPVIR